MNKRNDEFEKLQGLVVLMILTLSLIVFGIVLTVHVYQLFINVLLVLALIFLSGLFLYMVLKRTRN